ncbi:hypothetical protein AcW1_009829 [Taiwanofungus camphoratus]|nr:hypothetical protein AcW1_009829 [Antrodia cinnamomea]
MEARVLGRAGLAGDPLHVPSPDAPPASPGTMFLLVAFIPKLTLFNDIVTEQHTQNVRIPHGGLMITVIISRGGGLSTVLGLRRISSAPASQWVLTSDIFEFISLLCLVPIGSPFQDSNCVPSFSMVGTSAIRPLQFRMSRLR